MKLEPVTIINTNAHKTALEQGQEILRINRRKLLKFFITYYLFGGILLIYGLVNFSEYSKSYSRYSSSSKTIVYNYYSNHHWAETTGIVTIVVVTLLLIFSLRQRKAYNVRSNKYANAFLKGNNQSKTLLSDEKLYFDSKQFTIEIEWSLVKGYRKGMNYLLIYLNELEDSVVGIDTRVLTPEENERVIKFLNLNDVPNLAYKY